MTINQNHIPIPFLTYSSDILADTNNGLSGTDVVKALSAYAVEYEVHIATAKLIFQLIEEAISSKSSTGDVFFLRAINVLFN